MHEANLNESERAFRPFFIDNLHIHRVVSPVNFCLFLRAFYRNLDRNKRLDFSHTRVELHSWTICRKYLEIKVLDQYTGALILFILSVLIAVGMLAATTILGPKKKFADKMEPFECGESQLVSPHQRFSVKFYLIAVLFILFDVEVVFLFPWAVIFKRLGLFGLIEMMVFLVILGIGLLYVWKKGGLDWE